MTLFDLKMHLRSIQVEVSMIEEAAIAAREALEDITVGDMPERVIEIVQAKIDCSSIHYDVYTIGQKMAAVKAAIESVRGKM